MRVLQYHTDDTAEQQHDALLRLQDGHYDILHIYGCWQHQAWRMARLALKRGTRLVFSPQGQLEPWVIEENYWKDKLPKKLLYQRWIVSHAYAVIIQGKMEEECLKRLGWNPRLVIIRNPQITHSITQQEAARQLEHIYRMVMDSNQLELMKDDTRRMLKIFIKAGITRDTRWIEEDLTTIDKEEWRKLLCYAHQEHLTDTLLYGIRVLNYEAPDLDVSQIDYFLPPGYEAPTTIEQNIGSSFVSENQRLLATFRYLKKLWQHRRLAISHLVELDKELRFHYANEQQLCEDLQERHLLKLAARLMQLMADLTGLTEGFMLMEPLNDRVTRQMRKQIDNYLTI
jgi:hypothetical protein